VSEEVGNIGMAYQVVLIRTFFVRESVSQWLSLLHPVLTFL